MAKMIPALALAGGILLSMGWSVSPSMAAACGVEQAANAALQRRLAVIDAAKVNPSEFFQGANSCIDAGLLQSFDLSAVIPDLAGFLSGGIQNIAQNAINQAKQKVCEVINEQISKVIGKINDATSQFSQGLSGELAGLLGSSFNITPPSTPGYGQYNLASLGDGFNFNGLGDAVTQVGTSMPATVSPGGSSAISTISTPETPAPTTVVPRSGSNGGATWLSDQ